MRNLLIFHEGKSIDKSFFELLINDLGEDSNKIEFYGMGGKSNFFKKDNTNYQNVLLEIEEVNKILFIIDSDYETEQKFGGYKNTLKEIEIIQNELNIKEISDTFIAYDKNSENKEGYLESLILSTLTDEQNDCIKSFLEKCPEFKGKNSHKSIFNIIYKNAYPNKPFNFEHPNFDELKQKLTNLFNN
jgi:hypothetical protein